MEVKVAIVEDVDETAEHLRGYFERYAAENAIQFNITRYRSGERFLAAGECFSLVLMDIEMSGIDGMETARRLRARDGNVTIIFVTNLAQYAIKGYEVEAFDFIVKPVSYALFSVRLSRALQRAEGKREREIWVNVTGEGRKRILTSSLKYVEVMDHRLVFHTTEEDLVSNASMQSAVELLRGAPFALCNRCYLVNLAFVTGTRQFEVFVGGDVLQMSHLKRNDFLQKLNVYLSGGIVQC